MFGPTATLNFGLPAPDPSDASAQGMPQPSEAFPATAPDGAAQLAMLASTIPVNYQHSPELSAPLTSPPPPENQQGNQQSELLRLNKGLMKESCPVQMIRSVYPATVHLQLGSSGRRAATRV